MHAYASFRFGQVSVVERRALHVIPAGSGYMPKALNTPVCRYWHDVCLPMGATYSDELLILFHLTVRADGLSTFVEGL